MTLELVPLLVGDCGRTDESFWLLPLVRAGDVILLQLEPKYRKRPTINKLTLKTTKLSFVASGKKLGHRVLRFCGCTSRICNFVYVPRFNHFSYLEWIKKKDYLVKSTQPTNSVVKLLFQQRQYCQLVARSKKKTMLRFVYAKKRKNPPPLNQNQIFP